MSILRQWKLKIGSVMIAIRFKQFNIHKLNRMVACIHHMHASSSNIKMIISKVFHVISLLIAEQKIEHRFQLWNVNKLFHVTSAYNWCWISKYYHELSSISKFIIEYYVILRNTGWRVEIEMRIGEKHMKCWHDLKKRETKPEGFLVLCNNLGSLDLPIHKAKLGALKIQDNSCLQGA